MNALNEYAGQLVKKDDYSTTYHVSEVHTKANADFMLKVSLRDPTTGKIFQDVGRRNETLKKINEEIEEKAAESGESTPEFLHLLKKKEDIEAGKIKFNAEKSVYLRADELNKKIIAEKVDECTLALIGKYEHSLLRALKENTKVETLNANQMCGWYLEDFLRSKPRCSEETLKRKIRILKQVCEQLILKPVSELTEKDIKNLFSNPKFNQKRALISDFFEYTREKGAYAGRNPISEYIDSNPKGKAGANTQQAKILKHIELAEENKLHKFIEKHIDDLEIMALILVKCAGVTLSDAMGMRWKELLDDGNSIILIKLAEKSGGNRNLSRPVLREGTDLIRLVIGEKERISGPKCSWDNDLVIPIRNSRDKKKNKTARLTNYIRKALIKSGIPGEKISAVAAGNKKAGGSGVSLLRNHYSYVLSERCGLDRNSEEYDYMRGIAPSTILGKHYRSMNDTVSGIPYFETIVRRDDFYLPLTASMPSVKFEQEDAKQVITIPSVGARKRNKVTLEFYIEESTEIYLESNYGIKGSASYVSDLNLLPKETKIIY